VGAHRTKSLIERVIAHVHAAASGVQAVLFAVDGFAAYPKAILKHFYTPIRTGQPRRPAHRIWPDLHIVQVVKQHAGKRLPDIHRRVALESTWRRSVRSLRANGVGRPERATQLACVDELPVKTKLGGDDVRSIITSTIALHPRRDCAGADRAGVGRSIVDNCAGSTSVVNSTADQLDMYNVSPLIRPRFSLRSRALCIANSSVIMRD
jgi:hypothetical protein